MPAYTFAVKLSGEITITGTRRYTAKKALHTLLQACSANLGAFADGEPIIAELSADPDATFCVAEDGGPPAFPSKLHFYAAAMDDGWLPGDEDSASEYCEANDIDASTADVEYARRNL